MTPLIERMREELVRLGLDANRVAQLKLKWAFAFSGDIEAYAQPTIVGDRIFVGSEGRRDAAGRYDSGSRDGVRPERHRHGADERSAQWNDGRGQQERHRQRLRPVHDLGHAAGLRGPG